MSTDKKRLYTPPQECLEVIKLELKRQGLKSNNSTAVNQAVIFLAKVITQQNNESINNEKND
ncbi:MAG: hypothetical protein Unbinned3907contig1000_34 [Prokaryotic dsDNA virus sp.]|nr:MAG: hypothetical protein Unbinned3907contig1000_34 [Prokaryotic dsDNA virus sp.]|tara:strand:- start:774 stop:959 length:186 start_codon:yes stop_codon:yes gene_type:complete